MLTRAKRRLFEILHVAAPGEPVARAVNVTIMSLIVLSVISVILETVQAVAANHRFFFRSVEAVTVVIFSLEYLLRLWVCNLDPKYAGAVKGRLKFALSGYALIDFAAIAPFYVTLATRLIRLDLRFLRAVRLFRLFRLFKLGRYSTSLQTLGDVFNRKKDEILVTLFIVSIIIVLASSLMFFVENPAQPQIFTSIPAAMWWAVATLTTVGYGDIYPITPLGKFLGAIVAVMGIGLFALPAGLLGSAFIEEIQKRHKKPLTCPHCGKEIGDVQNVS